MRLSVGPSAQPVLRRAGAFVAFALAVTAIAARDLYSQGAPPQIPPREEIEKRVKEELAKLPDTTVERNGVKITYKAVPSDPAELIRRGVQLPPGQNVDQLIKQYGPMVQPIINQYMGEIGKISTDKELKIRSKTLPPGEYTFGIAFEQAMPVGIVIKGGSLKVPITAAIKPAKVAVQPSLSVLLEPDKKKAQEFTIVVGFHEWKGPTERWSAGAAK